SSVARTGQPFLPPFGAALVGRAGEPGITRYRPPVTHVSRQHLLHQHVGGLDANPAHSRLQAHHCVWSITGCLLETLPARILDLPYLITDEPPVAPCRDAAQPSCWAGSARPRPCASLQGARRPSSAWD